MKKLILFLVVFFAVSTLVNADGITRRIKFQKGQSAATYEGGVVRGDRDTYLLKASKNQMMTVTITSVEDNAVFQIKDTKTGKYLKDAGDGDDATSFMGKLPSSGDYKIIVGGTRGNASYTLNVGVE
jgi:hypothetical protein